MTFSGNKAGSGGSFKQTPDNLRSEDTFEGVLGLCIGPIKGPVRGLKSLKIDGTPIENETGELNFKDFIVNMADGDPAKHPQKVQLKLGAGASPVGVNISLTNSNTGAGTATPGPWVVRTLSNTNAQFIDLRFIVSQLLRQDKKGVYEATISLQIEMKPVGSTNWINPLSGTPSGGYVEGGIDVPDIDGGTRKVLVPRSYYTPAGTSWLSSSTYYTVTRKTTSPAVQELRIAVPSTGAYANTAWDIRVRLMERDTYDNGDSANNIQEKRTVSWESIAAVYGSTMGDNEDWRGLAWMQLYGKASDQLTGVPEIGGVYDTKIVKVPASSIYDPTTRQYTAGVWDGSWAYAYTNDPAWVINDAISDSLSGLALIAQGSYLNKWDALEASKWFSELVPDGDGGTHPRYSLNLAINDLQKAEDFIRYLAGACGGLAWDDGNGQWRMKVDKPETPVDLFTNENIEGEFGYSHTDVDTRFNDIIGKFKNEEMDFREDSVHLYDNPSIALIGRKPTTVALVGCTNRQEATRRIKLMLRTSVNEKKMVNFITNRRGRNVEPLDTILVADNDLGSKRTTGRVIDVAADRLSFSVRDPIRMETGVAYTVKFAKINTAYSPEPSVQPTSDDWKSPTTVLARTVTNTSGQRGDITTIYVSTALPADIAEYLTVALEATNLVTLPKQYRVLDVGYDEDGERVAISAIEIDTGKWAASDGVTKDDSVFVDLRGKVPAPLLVGASPLLSLITVPSEQGNNVNLMANWVRPAGANVSGFRVRYQVNDSNWQTGIERTQFTDFELINPAAGFYTFEITTISRTGEYSTPLYGSMEITQDVIDAGAINYADGTPIEDLKPAEPGATDGAPAGSPVAGRLAETLVDDVDLNAQTLLAYTFDNQTLRDYVDARIYVTGQPVNTVVADEKTQRINGDNALSQKVGLIGATNGAGTAFVLNLTTAEVGGGTTLGDKLTQLDGVATSLTTLSTTVGGYSSSITNLQTALVTPSGGASAKAIFQLNSNGHVQGYEATNNGVTGKIIFTFDSFELRDPSGVALFTAAGGVVKMPNVEVETIKIGAVGTAQLAANAVTVPSTTAGSDTFVSAGATVTLIETGFINVGDVNGGGAVLLAFGELDGGSVTETAGRLYLYIDSGSGYVLSATCAAGARTNSGADTYLKASLLASATVTGVTSIRARIDIMSFSMPGASGAKAFTIRSPQLVIMGAKR
jgi:predicted phage tail protein